LLNLNTVEDYKAVDMDHKIDELLKSEFIDVVENDKWIEHPHLLNRFLVVSFADLKKYIYQYRFHSLIVDDSSFSVNVTRSNLLHKVFKKDKDKLEAIKSAYLTYVKEESKEAKHNCPFVVYSEELSQVVTFKELIENPETHIVLFIDPSPLQPCIIVKNLLFALSRKFDVDKNIKIVSLRDKISKLGSDFEFKLSCYLEVTVNPPKEDLISLHFQKFEMNNNVLDLKSFFDPKSLAQSAVGLNLKLMKWRMAPDLDLQVAKNSKCLLLGSGSLGCQIARNLLSWGFEYFTFVDNGRVSFSNPVRQCLFTFQDSVDERPKAECAAERLKEIYPLAETKGITLSIPMPGHPAKTEEAEKEIIESYSILDELIQGHDVIFLITDSRESRWLPTVLSHIHNKICMTVALGFETFLAMRHGLSEENHDKDLNGETRLGCYFCNDTVAPRNSTQDRTLDQQCTVTRPAVCSMASAISTELLMSLLNHPLKNGALAHEEVHNSDRSVLGLIPHQVRGDMNEFRITPMCGCAFDM
jgi:ubiquitin-like modifier-activating enzyme ATG7